MAFETVLGDLVIDSNTGDSYKILGDLLDEKNIDMKTHIISPVTFSILSSISKNCVKLLSYIKKKKYKFPKFTSLLKDIIHDIKVFMVSWGRKSRDEITDTLKAIAQKVQDSRTITDRLLGIGAK